MVMGHLMGIHLKKTTQGIIGKALLEQKGAKLEHFTNGVKLSIYSQTEWISLTVSFTVWSAFARRKYIRAIPIFWASTCR